MFSLPIPYIGPSISRDHQTVANESKNILFLNASAKVRDARETSCHLVLMGNCLTCCPTHVLPLLSHQCFVNSPFWVFWEAWDPAATKEVLREKNMGLKSMQVNASKSITRMTKRGVYMRTGYIGTYVTWLQSTDCKKQGGTSCFDLVVAYH